MTSIIKKSFLLFIAFGILCPFSFAVEKIPVFVSILPQKFFTEQIGGKHVKVDVLVTPGKEPHDYAPTTLQITNLIKAKALFVIGVPFEKTLLPKITGALNSKNSLRIIKTQHGVTYLSITAEHEHHDGKEEKHAHEENHDHEGLDPHIWLDPIRAIKISDNIKTGLIEIDPAHKADYEKNFATLKTKLEQLDKDLAKSLKPLKGRKIFVFHPAFGYFCNRYNLIQEAVEVEGKSPSLSQLATLIKEARADKVKVIFLQPQFDPNAARSIAQAIKGAVVQLDPLAEHYITNLHRIAEIIGEYYKH